MKKRRMIARQLFISQLIVVEALCIATALAFYAYNATTLKNSEKARLASVCANTTIQVDSMVHSMDELSVSITVADGFIPAMHQLAAQENVEESRSQLGQIMGKAYLARSDAYRIVVLTTGGESVSVGQNELSKSEVSTLVGDGYWKQTDRRGNSKVLVGPFLDPWVKSNPNEVFSLVRAVRDGEELLGYIEVQMLSSQITRIYQNQWLHDDLYFVITTSGGDLFFSNFDPAEKENYLESVRQNAAWYPADSIETAGELISISSSNYTDWKTAVILPKSVLYSPLKGALQIAIIFSILMGFGINLFFKLIVEKITKPMERVVEQVGQVSLESLDTPFEYVAGSYEVEVLSDAFGTMKARLGEAFRQEKAMERMQTKALLETLQSRIGPHFLYNTLGSIANLCELGDAEAAASACFDLSDLLRYSSNYDTGLVTIQRELNHLDSYLALMKGRYRHRLQYSVEADPRCNEVQIPKLTIQPLIENAIKYSLTENEQVHIRLEIRRIGGKIRIRVEDNGHSFDQQVLENITGTLALFLADPTGFSLGENVQLRGIGLVGTLMRLYLLFGSQFHYSIDTLENGGAVVELQIDQDNAT